MDTEAEIQPTDTDNQAMPAFRRITLAMFMWAAVSLFIAALVTLSVH